MGVYPAVTDLGKKKNEKTEEKYCPEKSGFLIPGEKKTVHIAGMGDVGGTTATGLLLLGGRQIEKIGIYDRDPARCARWEMELNQTMDAFEAPNPEVYILDREHLFACDVFLFCIAQSVPEVGKENGDVRMVQLKSNLSILSDYAKEAAAEKYGGLFLVVSDPVDLLCKGAFLAARETGGLHPYQIQGCGLGVMNARAVYYAKKDVRFSSFLTEGRVFGPHGGQLVAANSIVPEHYRDDLSEELTEKVINANLEMRKVGYKPYIAPALSSAAYTVLKIISGSWNYSSNYLNGVYFGAKNRRTGGRIEWEETPLHPKLFSRLESSYRSLEEIL